MLKGAQVVVAFSRFRAANGREDAVREAFLKRPMLVDSVPGFLGLEVFTDTEDASLFYLITRWTQADSFRRWHFGPDHTKSQKGIPRGLKLDASFTLVRTLERISGPVTSLHPDGVRDFASLISEFLARSTSVHWLRVRTDGVIVAANQAIAKTISGASDSLNGAVIWSLLTDSDAAVLRRAVESPARDAAKRYRLNFVGRDRMPFTLECQIDVQPDGFMLIGEALQQHELALECELMTINNRLAVLLRENNRKTKALSRAKAGLEKAAKDLNDSYWHLRKIQEVLPICMRCGKVKTGEAKWAEVVEYLQQNSLIMSHGYCPDCLAKELDTMNQCKEREYLDVQT